MKNRSRLLNYQGSNQHTKHFRLSHKVKMHLSVYSLLTLATLTMMAFGTIHSRELDLKLHTRTAYAFVPMVKYTKPTINPNIDEKIQIQDLIRRIWGKDAYIGLAIARAESGYRPNAINHNTNGTYDIGVFQINSVHNMPDMEDVVANISYAYTLFLSQGTTPWNSSKTEWSKNL